MQRIQDLFEQISGMIPDKDSIKKKFNAIEKNVSGTTNLNL